MKKEVVNGSMVYIATWHLYLEMRRDRSIELFLVHSIQNLNYKKKKIYFQFKILDGNPWTYPFSSDVLIIMSCRYAFVLNFVRLLERNKREIS